MFNIKKIVGAKTVLLTVSLISHLSLAMVEGGVNGGGGGALVCKKSNGSITSAHVFDLLEHDNSIFEIKDKKYLIKVKKSNVGAKQQILKQLEFLRRLNSWQYDDEFKSKVETIENNINNAESILNDEVINGDFSKISTSKKVCAKNEVPVYSNVFVYYDNPLKIERYDKVYNKLATETDKAAIYMHEVLYALDRQEKSDEIRKIVAVLFSDLSDKDKYEILTNKIPWLCGKLSSIPEGLACILFARKISAMTKVAVVNNDANKLNDISEFKFYNMGEEKNISSKLIGHWYGFGFHNYKSFAINTFKADLKWKNGLSAKELAILDTIERYSRYPINYSGQRLELEISANILGDAVMFGSNEILENILNNFSKEEYIGIEEYVKKGITVYEHTNTICLNDPESEATCLLYLGFSANEFAKAVLLHSQKNETPDMYSRRLIIDKMLEDLD